LLPGCWDEFLCSEIRLPHLTDFCHHAHGAAFSVPLLVMDMYEHSYQMDYGAAAARYIDAFFVNLQWDTVASRFAEL